MKKIISILFLSLMILTGCNEKKHESGAIIIDEPTETTAETEAGTETETTTVRPTERVRDIVSTTDFEYEIIDGGVTITKYTGDAENVTVPDTIEDLPVTKIGFFAFEAHFMMQSVTLPETVETICEGAFMDCASMRSINLPESLTSIERSAFAACTSLESLNVPASVDSIEMEAFTACEAMFSLTINNPSIQYADWGLEELPNLTVYTPYDSPLYQWATDNGVQVSAF